MMPMFLQRANGTSLGTALFLFLGLEKTAIGLWPLASSKNQLANR